MTSRRAVLALATILSQCLAAPTARAAGSAPIAIATGVASEWKAVPADGVDLKIGSEAGALRLDFDFKGGGGYAVAHRAVSLDIPANYKFRFRVKGDCKPNSLEFKLIDASGENVWWDNQRDFAFAHDWQDVSVAKRHVSFAWGPLGGGEPHHIAALEFAVTAGQGGRGTVWIDQLQMQPLSVPDTTARAILARASSGARAAAAVDGDSATAWVSAPGDAEPALTLDLGAEREFGGLMLDWAPGLGAREYTIELSSDARAWRAVRTVRGSRGGRDHLDLPESEARYVRLRAARAVDRQGRVGLAEARVMPLAWSASRNDFAMAVARDAQRGRYPRSMLGEMLYWTVVGAESDNVEGLIDEYGRIEAGKGLYSIEPFVRTGGRLLTWNDATITQSLREGQLPVPTVEWRAGDVRLTVTASGIGVPGHAAILARYRLANDGAAARTDTLCLAVRPLQVDPPSQFLNAPGGVADIHELAFEGRVVRVNGARGFQTIAPPSAMGAATSDQGDVSEYLARGEVPPSARTSDAMGRASGALFYPLTIAAHAAHEVVIVIPLSEPPSEPSVRMDEESVIKYASELQSGVEARWRARQGRVTLQLPDSDVVHALKAQLAYVLINRDGPAIRPGTRSYARSWIRDGCLTSSALLRLGETRAVRDFIDWFAPHQYPSGKAPCCVDLRGADPTPEHDSSGELIYLIAEYYRYTGDKAFAETYWHNVLAAAGYLDTLRAQRLTPEWSTPEQAPFHGLLPPSISHEGYSAKPMHSYWDDFFALRGFKDAAFLAGVLGKPERAALATDRDAFQKDLVASLEAAMAAKHIDYLPGCADLGDFDATSTSIGLAPADAAGVLPKGALERTYEKYWANFTARRDGREPWDAYTPYEWRNVGAMVRLGWRDRAYEAMQWFMQDRRPKGFQHWAEVVWHDARTARFIGDMPHTWVGTDYVRSVLDMLAYEREEDSTLVLAAGVTNAWLADSGIVVKDLRTRWGGVSYSLAAGPAGGVLATLEQSDLRMPPGGIMVSPPLQVAAWRVYLNGKPLTGAPASVTVRSLPATIEWLAPGAPARVPASGKPPAPPRRRRAAPPRGR